MSGGRDCDHSRAECERLSLRLRCSLSAGNEGRNRRKMGAGGVGCGRGIDQPARGEVSVYRIHSGIIDLKK